MKKVVSLLLILSMLLGMLTGCGSKDSAEDNTLTISASYAHAGELVDAMIKEFPEINFDVQWYVGDNPGNHQMNRVRNNDGTDIITYANFTDLEVDTDRMLDLSGYSFIGNLSDEVQNVMNVGGSIYQIPSSLEVRCIAYNKTLFAENGWEAPQNIDEMISLVEQIQIDQPGITPIVMGSLPIYCFNMVSTMSQASYLFTSDGQDWEQRFFDGEASIEEGFKDGFTMMERLIDAGAFDFNGMAGRTQCEEEMVNREAAMYAVWIGTKDLLDAFDGVNTTDELGLIPFYGLNGEDTIVGYRAAVMWSLNKNLADSGNEKKLENALKVTEWFMSDEAQALKQAQIPVMKDSDELDPRVAELLSLAEGGYQEHTPYMGYEHILPNLGQIVQQAINSGNSAGMRQKIIAAVDNINKNYVANSGENAAVQLTENCNEAQTAQIAADVLQSSNQGDFALITHTGVKNGNVNNFGAAGRLYAGGISYSDMAALIMGVKGNLEAVTLEITGAEVKDLLETGKVIGGEAFEYYWSGIEVEFDKEKVTSVKLNGTELDDKTTYTVVFAPNDYPTSYSEKAVASNIKLLTLTQTYFQNNPKVETPAEQRS